MLSEHIIFGFGESFSFCNSRDKSKHKRFTSVPGPVGSFLSSENDLQVAATLAARSFKLFPTCGAFLGSQPIVFAKYQVFKGWLPWKSCYEDFAIAHL